MHTDPAATFAELYIAARVAARSAEVLADRFAAEDEAAKIARKARRAGVDLDEIDLDEVARRIVIA